MSSMQLTNYIPVDREWLKRVMGYYKYINHPYLTMFHYLVGSTYIIRSIPAPKFPHMMGPEF